MKAKEIRKLIFMNAKKFDYEVIDGRVNILAEKFERQHQQFGDLYCPCQTKRDEDTICPCKYMREYNACRCGLYKQGVNHG